MAGDRGLERTSTDAPSAEVVDDAVSEANPTASETPHPAVVPSDGMQAELDSLDRDSRIAAARETIASLPSDAFGPGREMQARLDQLNGVAVPSDAGDAPEVIDEPDLSGLESADVKGAHYEPAIGRDVVPEHPTVDNAQQRDIGDCYLIAAMDSVSRAEPERWSEIVHDNGDTVTVDFTRDGEKVPVTVAKTTLVDRDGQSFGAKSEDGTTMAPLVEKAYAKEFTGNSYAELGKGGQPHEALEAITGRPGQATTPDRLGPDDLRALVGEGRPVCAGSRSKASLNDAALHERQDDPDARRLPQGAHAYVVTEVDNTGRVQLHNPWGFQHTSLSWDQFERQCDYVGWS